MSMPSGQAEVFFEMSVLSTPQSCYSSAFIQILDRLHLLLHATSYSLQNFSISTLDTEIYLIDRPTQLLALSQIYLIGLVNIVQSMTAILASLVKRILSSLLEKDQRRMTLMPTSWACALLDIMTRFSENASSYTIAKSISGLFIII